MAGQKSAGGIYWCVLCEHSSLQTADFGATPPRTREYLTEREVERLIKRRRQSARHRDATMIVFAFRHGLRASALCTLRWDQIDLTPATGRHRRNIVSEIGLWSRFRRTA
jgi:integrase